MILMQIMGEKRLTNPTICKYLFMDIEHYIKLNKFSLEEITFFIDFYYRLNIFNSDHIEEIVSYLLSRKLTVADFKNENTFLKLFRGISQV